MKNICFAHMRQSIAGEDGYQGSLRIKALDLFWTVAILLVMAVPTKYSYVLK